EFTGRLTTNSAAFGGSATSTFTSGGFLGIGTSTPWANLSVHNLASSTQTTLFAIGSTTNVGAGTYATSTLFAVNNLGQALTPVSTASAPSYSFIGNTNFGFTLRSGNALDLVVSGTPSLDVQASSVTLRSGQNLAWSGTDDASASVGTRISRLSDGKLSLDSNIAGNSLGTLITSSIGLGTTTPAAQLAVNLSSITAAPNNTAFIIGSSTSNSTTTLFSVNNTGLITGLNFSLANGTTTSFAVTGSTTISSALNSTFANVLGSTTLLG